jgi:hypothetical protein
MTNMTRVFFLLMLDTFSVTCYIGKLFKQFSHLEAKYLQKSLKLLKWVWLDAFLICNANVPSSNSFSLFKLLLQIDREVYTNIFKFVGIFLNIIVRVNWRAVHNNAYQNVYCKLKNCLEKKTPIL